MELEATLKVLTVFQNSDDLYGGYLDAYRWGRRFIKDQSEAFNFICEHIREFGI